MLKEQLRQRAEEIHEEGMGRLSNYHLSEIKTMQEEFGHNVELYKVLRAGFEQNKAKLIVT